MGGPRQPLGDPWVTPGSPLVTPGWPLGGPLVAPRWVLIPTLPYFYHPPQLDYPTYTTHPSWTTRLPTVFVLRLVQWLEPRHQNGATLL